MLWWIKKDGQNKIKDIYMNMYDDFIKISAPSSNKSINKCEITLRMNRWAKTRLLNFWLQLMI